jgi:hypothetical protein
VDAGGGSFSFVHDPDNLQRWTCRAATFRHRDVSPLREPRFPLKTNTGHHVSKISDRIRSTLERRGRWFPALAGLLVIAVLASTWVGLFSFMGANAAYGTFEDVQDEFIPDVDSMDLGPPRPVEGLADLCLGR